SRVHLAPLFQAGLTTHRGRLRTIPARIPRGQVDHILVGGGLRIASAQSLRTHASDHRPLVAEVVPVP
ncbi:MAG: hypothetical protein ACLGHL_08185, partial [Actinomycetota bacterium]